MKASKLRIGIYILVLILIVSLTLVTAFSDNCGCDEDRSVCECRPMHTKPSACGCKEAGVKNKNVSPTRIWLAIATAFVECVSLGYVIVQDIITARSTIHRYGSLRLFATLDREALFHEVLSVLENKPNKHIIYINCSGLNVLDVENIKQRLYDGLTDYRDSQKGGLFKKNKLEIGNIHVPAVLETESFNEMVFQNTVTSANKKTVYIYDMNSANYYFIKMIEDNMANPNASNSAYNKNTYIIYLTNSDESDAIDTDLTSDDILDIADSKGEKAPRAFAPIASQNIKNVFTVKKLYENVLYKEIIKLEPRIISVLYMLKTGSYGEALRLLNEGTFNAPREYIDFLYADCYHLLNLYETAYNTLKNVINSNTSIALFKAAIELESHILKHMGYFNDEDATGAVQSKTAYTSSTSAIQVLLDKIALNKYFSNLKNALMNKAAKYSVKEIIKALECSIETSINLGDIDTQAKDKMYIAALSAKNAPGDALKTIDGIISYYEKIDDRLKYNAYYVKAEILRLSNDFDGASDYYIKSSGMLDGHHDFNLMDQNYFSLRALEKLGLIKENASHQLKLYKEEYLREVIGEHKKLLAKGGSDNDLHSYLKDFYEGKEPNEERLLKPLSFNKALLDFINSPDLTAEDLRKLLLENVFIIL